ncbi:hypothetical protein VPH35_114912 [Triticum aestivum]
MCADGGFFFLLFGPSSSIPRWSSTFLRRSSPVCGGMMSPPAVPLTSEAPGDVMKSVIGCISPFACTSLWDGVNQLNTTKVSVLAFFRLFRMVDIRIMLFLIISMCTLCGGVKIQDIIRLKIIETKGIVKWGYFKKILKDLCHSQNRSIMVISLLLNVESLKDGLEGMKQVAKMLKLNKRIGLATTEDGSYIYVCPGHKAKYGFWKGELTIDTNQDSLFGFVVRDQKSPVNTIGEISIAKIQEIGGTHVESQEVICNQQSYHVHPLRSPVDDGIYFRRPPLVLVEQGRLGILLLDYQVKDYILDILLNPHAPECQEIFHQLPPCPRGQGFITHRAHNFALEYFKPLIDHGYNNGSQHLRPPTGSAPGHLWHRMSCPRSKNNHPGFERSEGFSGYSSTYYSRFKNGLGSTPPN